MIIFKRALGSLICIILGLVAAVLIAEFILRIVPVCKEKYSFDKYVNRFVPIVSSDDLGSLYRFSSSLGYERVPDRERGVNSFGFIGEEIQLKKKYGVFRIMVLGDSLAEQNFFVDYLRKFINDRSLKETVEIINAGVGGYNVWHYYRYVTSKALKFKPDAILLSLCLNDFHPDVHAFYGQEGEIIEFNIESFETKKILLFSYSFFKNSFVYRALIITLEEILSKSSDKSALDNVKNFAYANEGLFFMKKIKQVCDRNNIALVCFIWPYFMPNSEYSNLQMYEYNDMVKILDYLSIDYLDLHKLFPDNKRKNLRLREVDYIHPNAEAHKSVALSILPTVEQLIISERNND
ncbi:MAG: SGNH/GDSL hydrolase family protein [Candidatus Gygaella obscura]|nr:SGNH/GDSL hydrolase family protein [Candidatus Gygaella obscura]